MPAQILDGNKIAAQVRAEVAARVAKLKEERGITPGLSVILVGENPASQVYVRNKARACEEVGISAATIVFPKEVSEAELIDKVRELNHDPRCHGILVQLPLPPHINESKVLYTMSPEKDVDGLHPVNMGRLLLGEPVFPPCTPQGIQELLIRSGHSPEGKHVVICGRSNIVGRPLAALLLQKRAGANATVTICHTGTLDLARHTLQADILVVATGYPNTVTGAMMREGAVVIDVGINRVEDPGSRRSYRLVGDVDFEAVKERAGAITPVPGGVGPMTVAMLLVNTLKAASLTPE